MKKKQYVLGYIFDEEFEHVLLIHKNRPEWQKGKMNGIGGKVEFGETNKQAIVREVREETSLEIPEKSWKYVGVVGGVDWEVHVLATVYKNAKAIAKSLTDEKIEWSLVNKLPENVIKNLTWQIPLSKYALESEMFKDFHMEYTNKVRA